MKSRKIRLFFILSISLIFTVTYSYSQQLILKVVDENDRALEGASVIHKNSNYIGTTDIAGIVKFLPKNIDAIQIKYLGYEIYSQPMDQSFIKNPIIKLKIVPFNLNHVTISHTTKALDIITDIDIKVKPVSSSQEILRTVPGLFIGQHAGGGKAEQMFLRGFDIDHGTDVAVSVDGMPVNMVSHAHGQGYADLHFVLPEAVESVDFGKGSYYADKGNLATAAFVDFKLKDRIEQSTIKFEAGQFNSFRLASLVKLSNSQKSSSFIGGEYNSSDGWFESPQNFYRTNLVAKWKYQFNNSHSLSITGSHFESKWNASGQIPQREVQAGRITRFGAIDDNEGGETARQNIQLHLTSKWNQWQLKQQAYLSRYSFDLYSNFTFFLNDPEHGDQIRQKENRWMSGYTIQALHKKYFDKSSYIFNVGAGLRNDHIDDNQLSHTINRTTEKEVYRKGNIGETNAFAFVDYQMDFGKLLINPAIRADHFYFSYFDLLASRALSNNKSTLSPKLNFIYQSSENLQYYLKSGIGFHSNDARLALDQSVQSILPKSYGADLGLIWKQGPQLVVNTAMWILDLEQEFVYVGDEGIIEPSGKTRRKGFDIGLRYQPKSWLFINMDANYSHGRNKNYEGNNKFIPLAPVWSSVGTITANNQNMSGSFSFRHLSDRPATEDNTLRADGYIVNDLAINYSINKINLQLRAENIFNVKWNETQFATTSRLRDEANPVEEIHFTPGTPFFVRAGLSIYF